MEIDLFNLLCVCEVVNWFVCSGDVIVGDGGDFVGIVVYVMKFYGVGTWMDPGFLGMLGVGSGYVMVVKFA